jgi:SAM-dependent methyltransferase
LTEAWSAKYRADGLTRAGLGHAVSVASLQETRRLVRPGMRVLEAGSGTGRLSVALAANEPVDVIGVDNSEGSLRASRLLLEQVDALLGTCQFTEADLHHLPFEDESFDVVFSDSVWEHLDDPRMALQEVVRVLRHGGSFVFTTPNRWRPDGWDLYRRLARPPYRQDSFSPLALRGLAAEAGLRPVRIFGDELWLERNIPLLRVAATRRLGAFAGRSSRADQPATGKAPASASRHSSAAASLRPRLRRVVDVLLPQWLRIHVGVIATRP